MNLKSFLKKDKVFSALLITFLIWIAILAILAITANRVVTFYDWVDEKDVSSHYTSEIPILRYFIEPFVGLTLILGGYDAIIGLAWTVIIYRIVYFHLKKKGLFESEKAELLWYPVRDWIRFSFIILSICITIGFIIVGIMYVSVGFLYVNLYWMAILLIIMFGCLYAIIAYGIVVLIKFYHPKLKFKYHNKKRYNPPEPRSKREKYWRSFRKECVYVVGISLLVAGCSMVLLTIQFPMHHIQTDLDDDEVLLDFHIHTYLSDGWLSPQERVQWYIDHGLNGAVFSDHDNQRAYSIAKRYIKENNLDFTVFRGEEWTDHVNDIHMNIFGLDEVVVPLESKTEGGPKAMNAEDTIKYVKDHGAYICVNHYNFNENPDGGHGTPYTLKELMKWGVDGFEIVNGGGAQNLKIREFCLNNSLICIGGSDIHTNKELDTVIKLKVDDPKHLDIDEIFKNLKKNEHQVVAIDTNPKHIDSPGVFRDLELDYIRNFEEYMLNLNSLQVLSWILWSTGGFLIMTFFYKKVKKLDVNKLREKIL